MGFPPLKPGWFQPMSSARMKTMLGRSAAVVREPRKMNETSIRQPRTMVDWWFMLFVGCGVKCISGCRLSNQFRCFRAQLDVEAFACLTIAVVPIGFAWIFRSDCRISFQQRIASCQRSHHQLTENGRKPHRLLKDSSTTLRNGCDSFGEKVTMSTQTRCRLCQVITQARVSTLFVSR